MINTYSIKISISIILVIFPFFGFWTRHMSQLVHVSFTVGDIVGFSLLY